ncbi:GNAT family N-acetyltransferase [Streptomyces cocklensis]|nr:GNAT family N-acetyltransferase [Actinacidiphila cocklensis]MDD1057159.1 GNAT family N-acetyltransferase [Actinacidiphila cocklensis]
MTTVIAPVASRLPHAAGSAPRPAAPRWRTAVVTPADAGALRDLFAACSQDTVRLRFFGRVRALPAEYLDDVLAGRADVHDAVVAYEDGASGAHPAGLASLALPPGAQVAELGVLVADAWQRQGAGRAMVDLLLARARARGVPRVGAAVLPGRSGLLAALGRRLPAEHLALSADGPSGVYKLD